MELTKSQFLSAAHEFLKARTLRFSQVMDRYSVHQKDWESYENFLKTRVQENRSAFFDLIVRVGELYLIDSSPSNGKPLSENRKKFLDSYLEVAIAGKAVTEGSWDKPMEPFWEKRGRKYGHAEPKQGNPKLQGRIKPQLLRWVEDKGGWSFVRALIEREFALATGPSRC